DYIEQQASHYRCQGLPANAGLFETNFMVVHLADDMVERTFSTWWNQIELFSRRDQLALAWALHQHSISVSGLLPEDVSVREDEDFVYFTHTQSRGLTIHENVCDRGKANDPYNESKFCTARESALVAVSETPIDIIVCVYNALEDVRLCLESVRQHLRPKH